MGSVSCTSGKCCSAGGSGGPGNRVFVSHCKRIDASEDRAIWVADNLDHAGFKAWFDRSDLQEITEDKLKEAVEASHCLITILDPFTFESPWVVKENEWAKNIGIPILLLYDGDRYRWEQVAKWQVKHPHAFKYPALEYVKNYRTESRNKLIAAVHERICEWSSSPKQPSVSDGAHSKTDQVRESNEVAVRESNEAASDPTPSLSGRNPSKSSSLSIDTNVNISVAVGCSSAANLQKAAEGACAKLVQKLHGQPTFIIASVSCPLVPAEKKMEIDVVRKQIEKAFPDVPYIGGTSCVGISVDSTWTAPQANAVALWGVNDPGGVYEVAHVPFDSQFEILARLFTVPIQSSQDVEARNEIAFEAGSKAALQAMDQARAKVGEGKEVDSPQFVFMLPSPGHENKVIDGISSVLGKTPILGGSAAPQFLTSGDHVPSLFSSVQSSNAGVCMALCWPSVHVAAAFCSGFEKKPRQAGTVTKVKHQYQMLEIDGKPARDVALEWAGLRESWEKGHNSDPFDVNPGDAEFQRKAALDGMIAVEVGKDQDGEPLYRNSLIINWPQPKDGDGIIMMTPVAVGDRIAGTWSTPENLSKRTAKVAKQLLRLSGFNIDEVRGGLCIMCAENILCAGPDAMQELCEELNSSLGFAPCMGLITYGEQGMIGDGKSYTGCLMYSTVIFTTKRVDCVMTPGREYKSLKNIQSMLLSEQGVVREMETQQP